MSTNWVMGDDPPLKSTLLIFYKYCVICVLVLAYN